MAVTLNHGLSRLGITVNSDDERHHTLAGLIQDIDERFGKSGFSPLGKVMLGAVAEELGFPDVAARFFNWTLGTTPLLPDPSKVASRAAAPVAELPRSTRASDARGVLLYCAGRFEEARHDFAVAVADAPSDVHAAIHLARTHMILGDDMQVVRTLEPHATTDSPRQAEVLKELASACFRLGDPRADSFAERGTRAERADLIPFVAEFELAMQTGLREKLSANDDYLDADGLRFMWHIHQASLDWFGKHEDHIAFAHALTRDAITSMVRLHPAISTVVEFGVLNGSDAFKLAGELPQIAYIGVDRSPAIKDLNDSHFARPNLRYEAADIIEFISNGTFASDVALVHSRTTSLCYPAAVSELYATAAAKGIRHIVLVEEFGISRATGKFVRFEEGGPLSIPLRPTGSTAHDHVRYLNNAGYEVTSSELTPITAMWKLTKLVDAHMSVVHAILRK